MPAPAQLAVLVTGSVCAFASLVSTIAGEPMTFRTAFHRWSEAARVIVYPAVLQLYLSCSTVTVCSDLLLLRCVVFRAAVLELAVILGPVNIWRFRVSTWWAECPLSPNATTQPAYHAVTSTAVAHICGTCTHLNAAPRTITTGQVPAALQ